MGSQTYDSDLTDDEWSILNDVWALQSARGAPARWLTREIVNAVLYVLRGVIAWSALPHDVLPWRTVYDHFRQLKLLSLGAQ